VCRAGGRNRLNSSGVACGLGELPPSQWKPITGHKAVHGRPSSANGHLRADRIGPTGDAHDWDQEGNHPKSPLHRDVVGHRFAMNSIGSDPSVATYVNAARGNPAVATTYEMEADES
jgi:hypothetical protein